MKRKLLLVLPLICFATSGFATTNFYLGVGGGGEFVINHKDLTIIFPPSPPPIAPVPNETISRYASMFGGFGELFAGVDYRINPDFSLALEANGNLGSTEGKTQIRNFPKPVSGKPPVPININIKERLKGGYGVSLLPAVNLSPRTKLFVRAGAVRSKFTSSAGDDALSETVSGNLHKWLWGGRFGVGGSVDLGQNFSARLEYDFTQYQTFNSAEVLSDINQTPVKVHYNLRNNQVWLAIAYHIPFNEL